MTIMCKALGSTLSAEKNNHITVYTIPTVHVQKSFISQNETALNTITILFLNPDEYMMLHSLYMDLIALGTLYEQEP